MNGMENVVTNGAIGISLTGMAIVFSGLVLISLAITWLPKILDFWEQWTTKQKNTAQNAKAEGADEEKDLASVIGLVMQMEAAHHEAEEHQEDLDIANVIGLVLHLEQERQFAIPN